MNKTAFLLVAALTLSCSRHENRIMDSAESIMFDKPDSALIILTGISHNQIRGAEASARYALLMSMALDKCYIDTPEDSLISKAVEYYQKDWRNPRYRMYSHYYHGRILINAGKDVLAAASLMTAEKEAILLGEPLHAGLAERNLASLYTKHYENSHAIDCAESSVRSFREAGLPAYLHSAQLSLARAYENDGRFEEGKCLLESLLQDDTFAFRKEAEHSYAELLFNHDPSYAEEALKYFRLGESVRYDASDYGSMARASLILGNKKDADRYLSKADSLTKDAKEDAALSYDLYVIDLLKKDSLPALRHLEVAASLQDSLTRSQLQQSFSSSLLDLERHERELEREKQRRVRMWIAIYAIAVGFLIIWLYRNNHRKKIALKDLMGKMDSIRDQLTHSEREKNALVNSILEEQIDALHLLSEEYFRCNENKKQSLYYKAFRQRLSDLRDHQATIPELENQVNRLRSNAMAVLREEVPSLSPYSYKLSTLFFAGLPYEVISLLTQSSVLTLRTQKSLIKKAILQQRPPHAVFLLACLDSAVKRPAGRPREQ